MGTCEGALLPGTGLTPSFGAHHDALLRKQKQVDSGWRVHGFNRKRYDADQTASLRRPAFHALRIAVAECLVLLANPPASMLSE